MRPIQALYVCRLYPIPMCQNAPVWAKYTPHGAHTGAGKGIIMIKLTEKQADMVTQVAATLAIEGMALTEEDYRNLAEVASGRKTEEEMAEMLIKQCREESMPGCRN